MKHLFTLISVATLLSYCTSGSSDQASSQTEDSTAVNLVKRDYLILKVDDHQSFKNFDVLIDSTKATTEDLKTVGAMFSALECRSVSCNNVTLWTSERAMNLWYAKTNDPGWRRKYWPYICEHNAAEYSVSINELNIFPLVNSEYKRWGGKNQRPNPHSFEMP